VPTGAGQSQQEPVWQELMVAATCPKAVLAQAAETTSGAMGMQYQHNGMW